MASSVTGVDGCKEGWIAVHWKSNNAAVVAVYNNFQELAASCCGFIAVDIPIGLRDRLGPDGRGPEKAVRPNLGKRKSSVFSVPSRKAIYAEDYDAARQVALCTSDPAKSVSKQSFAIFPKIREIDTFLRRQPAEIARVFESHPELAFWQLNGQRPLEHYKKTDTGKEERRLLLEHAGFSCDFIRSKPPPGAAVDDLLDACACAVVARRIALRKATPFPDRLERDEFGLPIAIWA